MVKITLTSKELCRVAPRPRMKKTFMLATMYDILLTVVWSTSMDLSFPHAKTVSLNFACITVGTWINHVTTVKNCIPKIVTWTAGED